MNFDSLRLLLVKQFSGWRSTTNITRTDFSSALQQGTQNAFCLKTKPSYLGQFVGGKFERCKEHPAYVAADKMLTNVLGIFDGQVRGWFAVGPQEAIECIYIAGTSNRLGSHSLIRASPMREALRVGAAANRGRELSRFLRYNVWVQNFTSC